MLNLLSSRIGSCAVTPGWHRLAPPLYLWTRPRRWSFISCTLHDIQLILSHVLLGKNEAAGECILELYGHCERLHLHLLSVACQWEYSSPLFQFFQALGGTAPTLANDMYNRGAASRVKLVLIWVRNCFLLRKMFQHAWYILLPFVCFYGFNFYISMKSRGRRFTVLTLKVGVSQNFLPSSITSQTCHV